MNLILSELKIFYWCLVLCYVGCERLKDYGLKIMVWEVNGEKELRGFIFCSNFRYVVDILKNLL